jgi:hypothetical protein
MSRGEQQIAPQDLAAAVHALLKTIEELKEVSTAGGQDRFFFPQGIQRIHLALTLGQKDAPIASIELDLSGQKADGPVM